MARVACTGSVLYLGLQKLVKEAGKACSILRLGFEFLEVDGYTILPRALIWPVALDIVLQFVSCLALQSVAYQLWTCILDP
jgi:hypothetical protein